MEISNKTIAILLVATICVYLAGTLFTFNKLAMIQAPRFTGLTQVNTSGFAQLQVQANTVLTFVVSSVDWGSGWVDATSACVDRGCTMTANGTGTALGCSQTSCFDACCKNFKWINDTLLLRNAGNRNLTVEMNITQNQTAMFGAPGSRFYVKFTPTSTRGHVSNTSTDTATPCPNTGFWNNASNSSWMNWTNVFNSSSWYYVCGESGQRYFSSLDDENEVNLDVQVNISSFEATGLKNTTISCRGTSD